MADSPGGVVGAVARRRVALGFVSAAVMLVLARPTWDSWRAGLLVAAVGECLRLWAAGHLEKGREVTRSGPYRFLRHPLYAGSMLIAIGVAIAARGALPALLAGLYMGVTVAAAIQVEEMHLREAFGTAYDDYEASRAAPMRRRFSYSRAMRNREHRALGGLALGFALLALKLMALE
jgi:protein-S-isoprenylcysteine O-methyltransferase Ste14